MCVRSSAGGAGFGRFICACDQEERERDKHSIQSILIRGVGNNDQKVLVQAILRHFHKRIYIPLSDLPLGDILNNSMESDFESLACWTAGLYYSHISTNELAYDFLFMMQCFSQKTPDSMLMPYGPKTQVESVQITMQELAAKGLAAKITIFELLHNICLIK
ncbi:hypothetical protein IEQ34_018887 [Dendrobium chrysotoxum]|uniref:Uncharacterized protein n=1 Tax=Dendrobium chrysotoxum TaxID=161865 RepID=A0AAV7G764_DENCH|nr:hypothetical protein IEQ34_018887 [Dendrobium chrysotoxum]